jgi:hypothetical protein
MEHIIYKIIKYGIDNKIVVKRELFESLNLDDEQQAYFSNVLKADSKSTANINNLYVEYSRSSSPDPLDFQYMLTPSALMHYHEYVELIDAKKASADAKRQSIMATMIAVAALLLSFVQVFFDVYDRFFKPASSTIDL